MVPAQGAMQQQQLLGGPAFYQQHLQPLPAPHAMQQHAGVHFLPSAPSPTNMGFQPAAGELRSCSVHGRACSVEIGRDCVRLTRHGL